MILSELLKHLSGVRKGGNGYVARCPSHDDKHQSLSLTEDTGRILICCHAGCQTSDILDRLKLQFRDLYDKRIETPSRSSLGEPVVKTFRDPKAGFTYFAGPNTKKIHTVYRYTDENGQLLYENIRYYPKDFRQRTYDVNKRPIWNLDNVRRVPYRLPELIKGVASGSDVFLCEGEKDADALRELGFVATNLKSWKPEFTKFIRGCHVIIVQDHDVPGVAHAEEVASMILREVASVKILDVWAKRELPDKAGPDISDFIRVCVQDEGLDADTIKERISLHVERTDRWKQAVNLSKDNYFVVRSGNEWLSQAKHQPVPKMLFGEFWFEGELCILFADTNVGKSILAVQIGDAISNGIDVGTIPVECIPQKVVYFDFELTTKQFESRFSQRVEGSEQYVNHYRFHHNFYRAEINPETTELNGFKNFEEFVNHSLDTIIFSTGAKVLIVDNLTYLKNETENARNALPLMKFLKELKSKHGLSILALAHTPKRDASKPIGRNDLQGSKMLINFCDSSFAIGESAKHIGMRYLKQIKARNTEIIYGADHVCLANMTKDSNFVKFAFCGFGNEFEHLKAQSDIDKKEMAQKAKDLAAAGMKYGDIAEQLGVSKMSVSRYVNS
jgi:hypothetical protein